MTTHPGAGGSSSRLTRFILLALVTGGACGLYVHAALPAEAERFAAGVAQPGVGERAGRHADERGEDIMRQGDAR